MSKIKKIIRGGFESALEFLKPAAKIVTPDRIVGQITGHPSGKSEMTEYLQKLGDHKDPANHTKSPKEDRQESESVNSDEKVQNLRTYLQSIPRHLRPPPGPPPLRPYEATVKDRKNMLEKENNQKAAAPLVTPTGRQRGMFGAKKRQSSNDMERKINKKSG